jgi:hypothetical protein
MSGLRIPSSSDTEPQTEQAPWEGARLKIEFYMHENLRQVRWIFVLTLVVMLFGFGIILSGAALAFYRGQQTASIVVTLSGLLVEFIGATFLIVYKNTMEQAMRYVSILQKIITIGTSVNLINGITYESERQKAQAKIASEILSPRRVEESE